MTILNRNIATFYPNALKKNNRWSKFFAITCLFSSILSPLIGLSSSQAAEQVTLNYGPFGRTVPMSELEELATTGKASGTLKGLLKLAKEDPKEAQRFLTAKIPVDVVTIDQLLNTQPGQYLLKEIGRVVHTPSNHANVQALRSALVLSASKDNSISLINFFNNYPDSTVYINGVQLQKDVKEVNSLLGTVHKYLNHLQCNCTTAQAVVK